MASHSPPIFSAIVIFASLFINPLFGVPNETIFEICSKTQHRNICVTNLQTDPRTSSADLPKLSLISLDQARRQTEQNLQNFKQLSQNATTNELKQAFDDCVEYYREVKAKIDAANVLSRKREYTNNTGLLEAKDFAMRCEVAISENLPNVEEFQESAVLKVDTSITVNTYIGCVNLRRL